MKTWIGRTVAIVAVAAMATAAWGQARERVEADGTVHVPAFDLPLPPGISPQAKAYIQNSQKIVPPIVRPYTNESEYVVSAKAYRADMDAIQMRWAQAQQRVHPAIRQKTSLGGAPVIVITPKDGVSPKNRRRVLINLHGGAFMAGAWWASLAESLPVADVGKFKVVSVDYRQGYEHTYPAATDDVIAVYKELLKTYPARNIGIYGCSAGSMLAGQTMVRILQHGLPRPGAIGMYGSGFGGAPRGDAYFTSVTLAGYPPPPIPKAPAAKPPGSLTGGFGYMSTARIDDPAAYPASAPPALLARFPPTQFMTGLRALDYSSVVHTHRQLARAGVDVDLHAWEGLQHCAMFYGPDMPEATDAYVTLARFFDRHLGR